MNEECRAGVLAESLMQTHIYNLDQAQEGADPDETHDPKTDTKVTSLNRMQGLFWYSSLCHKHTYIQFVQMKD